MKKLFPKQRIVVCLIFFVGLLTSRLNFTNTEFAIYDSYNKSIIYDGDLNLSNQIYFENETYLNTTQGFYYTQHSYGAAIVTSTIAYWSYLVGQMSGMKSKYYPESLWDKNIKPFLVKKGSIDDFISYSSAFGTYLLVFTFLIFFIIVLGKRVHIDSKNEYFMTSGLLIASGPALFYLLFAQSTPNLLCLIPLALLFYYKSRENNELELGLCLGLGTIIRIDFVLYALFIFLWSKCYESKDRARNILKIIIGFSLFYLPYLVFDTFKSGSLSSGYFETIYLNTSLFFDFLFSAYGGAIIVHPILIVLILISFYHMYRNRSYLLEESSLELIIAILIIFIKILLMSFTYSHNGGVIGARQLLQDFVLLALLICSSNINLFKNILIKGLCLILCVWNILLTLTASVYDLNGLSIFSMSDEYIHLFSRVFETSLKVFQNPVTIIDHTNVINNFLNFIPVLLVAIIFYSKVNKKKYLFYFLAFFHLLIVSSSLIKANSTNSDNNHLVVKTDCLSCLMYYENVGSMMERYLYLKKKNRVSEARVMKGLIQKYHKDVETNLGTDPIQLVKEIRSESYINELIKIIEGS